MKTTGNIYSPRSLRPSTRSQFGQLLEDCLTESYTLLSGAAATWFLENVSFEDFNSSLLPYLAIGFQTGSAGVKDPIAADDIDQTKSLQILVQVFTHTCQGDDHARLFQFVT